MIKSDEGRTTECHNFLFALSVFSLEMEKGSHLSCLIITHGQNCPQSQSNVVKFNCSCISGVGMKIEPSVNYSML